MDARNPPLQWAQAEGGSWPCQLNSGHRVASLPVVYGPDLGTTSCFSYRKDKVTLSPLSTGASAPLWSGEGDRRWQAGRPRPWEHTAGKVTCKFISGAMRCCVSAIKPHTSHKPPTALSLMTLITWFTSCQSDSLCSLPPVTTVRLKHKELCGKSNCISWERGMRGQHHKFPRRYQWIQSTKPYCCLHKVKLIKWVDINTRFKWWSYKPRPAL